MTSEQPAAVGRYQIVRPLGAGAMGEVFLALDPNIDRHLAIKTVRLVGPPNEIEDRKQRLLREAKAAGRLLHPNVVTLFDAGEHEGLLYLAFEFVEGQDLSHRMVSDPPLNLGEVLRMAREVASALELAHQQGIVHRDIKPSNILIGSQGEAKVADFGIAKLAGATTQLTQTGSVVGSPQYMSPEQIRGEALDGRSDLFSLGVVIYELLTQRRPFDGDTLSTLVFQILSEEPIAVDQLRDPLPARLTGLVHRLLAKTPVDRPSARELVVEINDLERQLSIAELAMPLAQTFDLGSTQENQATTQLPPPIPIPASGAEEAPTVGTEAAPAPSASAHPPTASAPPPLPPPPAAAASGGTYAVPAAKGRKIPLFLALAAVFLLGLGWAATQFFGGSSTTSSEVQIAATSDQPPGGQTSEPAASGDVSQQADFSGANASGAGSVEAGSSEETDTAVEDATSENTTVVDDSSELASASNSSGTAPPSSASAGQLPPQQDPPAPAPPQTAAPTPSSNQETTRPAPTRPAPTRPAGTPQAEPPRAETPGPPPSSQTRPQDRPSPPPPGPSSSEPLEAPPLALPKAESAQSAVDPDVARFIRATQRARLELDTGLKLRFDVDPKETIVRLWRRGDRRAIVQGQVNLFQAGKKKARDLDLPAEGDYLVGLYREGLPEDAILIHASASPGRPATVISSDLSKKGSAGPRLLKTGRLVAFRGDPRDAVIYLDNVPKGKASDWPGAPRPGSPLNLRLQPGAHTLRLEAPGYEPYSLRLEVQDGIARKRVIEYQLQKK